MVREITGGIVRKVAAEKLAQGRAVTADIKRVGSAIFIPDVEGIGNSGLRVIGKRGEGLQLGFQLTSISLENQGLTGDVEPVLLEVRAFGQRLFDQLPGGREVEHRRHFDMVERNDVDVRQHGVFNSVFAQGVFEDDFLLQNVGLCQQHILLAGWNLGLGAGRFDGRLGANSDLLPAVLVQLSGRLQRLPFEAQVLVEGHQVPIQVQDGGNRGDHLKLELQIGHLDIVSGDADVAAVHRGAEALQRFCVTLTLKLP